MLTGMNTPTKCSPSEKESSCIRFASIQFEDKGLQAGTNCTCFPASEHAWRRTVSKARVCYDVLSWIYASVEKLLS